jgi:CDP-ribitol ribitolphosphotransferase
MQQYESWRKRSSLGESKGIISFLKRGRQQVAKKAVSLIFAMINALSPKRGNRILFMSETKEVLWGNIQAIDTRLKERNLTERFHIDYSFRRVVGQHQSILSWFATMHRIAQADYIFTDDYAPILGFIKLSPKVKLIQVWHAGIGFKAVGYCRFGKKGSPYPMESCHKKYTNSLAGSAEMVKVFEEVFGIEGSAILPIGIPRLDGFLDPDRIEAFRTAFYTKNPTLKEKKIILFAPTYRGVGQASAYYNYEKIDFDKLYDFCGAEYVVLMKMHPFIIEGPPVKGYEDRILDFSDFPEINDLYYVTDILITDYSSSYYEYSLLQRPILFYTYDRTIYEVSRGVHQYVKDSAPGKVCDTFDELLDALRNQDFELEKTKTFVKNNFGEYDNHATDRLIDAILLDGGA